MTTAGFITLLVLLTIGAIVFIEIAGLPGREARKRNHPSADAINLLGWLGLPLGVFGWLVAMVWAHIDPIPIKVIQVQPSESVSDETDGNTGDE